MTQPAKNLTAAQIVADLGSKIAKANERLKPDHKGREQAANKLIAAMHAVFNACPKAFTVDFTHAPTWITIKIVTTTGAVPVLGLQAADGVIQLDTSGNAASWRPIELEYDPLTGEFENGENALATVVGNVIDAWMKVPRSH